MHSEGVYYYYSYLIVILVEWNTGQIFWHSALSLAPIQVRLSVTKYIGVPPNWQQGTCRSWQKQAPLQQFLRHISEINVLQNSFCCKSSNCRPNSQCPGWPLAATNGWQFCCQNKSSFSFKSISYDHWLVVIDVELWRRQIKRMDARTAQKYETRESSLCFHETAIRGFYSDFRLNWTRRRAKRGKEGRADLTLDSGTC